MAVVVGSEALLARPLGTLASLGLLLGAVFSFFVLQAIYFSYFHRLSKIPGPKLYACSTFPYFYHLLRGDWAQKIKDLHDKYGPVVRFGPNDVSFITANASKAIYGHKTFGQEFAKSPEFYERGQAHASIINSNHDDHKRMRRLLAHAFSEKALRSQMDIINQYIDKFIHRLGEQAHEGNIVDIVKWYNFTTFDIIGDLAFGDSFGCLDSGGYHPWVNLVFDNVRAFPYKELAQRLKLNAFVSFLIPKKMRDAFDEHNQLAAQTALKRIEDTNNDRADFTSYILRHNDEKGMSKGEIAVNADVLIAAGSETTATALSGATFHLLTNRPIYEKLVDEIRSSFQTEEEITLDRVNQLTYLIAVLSESMRMYPPVPIGLPRLVPSGGEVVEGYWLPEQTVVSVPHLAAYSSESNYLEPESFCPERWLGDPKFDQDSKAVFQPFSTGPRNCIGKNLAYAEMRLIFTRLLWKFDLELLETSSKWNKQKTFVLWEKGALNVKLTEVKRTY